MGEKPLVTLFGRPLIDYVALALEDSCVDRIFVATTDNVPHTREWTKQRDLSVVETGGYGYVADMIEAVKKAEVEGPIMIIMADLPLVTSDLIDEIIEVYEERPEPALSTHPLWICTDSWAEGLIPSSTTRTGSSFRQA